MLQSTYRGLLNAFGFGFCKSCVQCPAGHGHPIYSSVSFPGAL